MKKYFLSLVILFGGCTSTAITTFEQNVLQNQVLVSGVSDLATVGVLTQVPVADRVVVAQHIYEIAYAINQASSTQVDLTALDALANQQLTGWNSPYAPLVASLIRQLSADVSNYLNSAQFASSTDAQKLTALQDFLQSVSAGVMSATLAYTPNMVPVVPAGSVKSKVSAPIVVVPFVWVLNK